MKSEDIKKHYKTGFVAGSFDLFHIGHLKLMRRAKEHCDYLIAGVLQDELIYKIKGKWPVIPLNERMEIVSGIRYADRVEVVTEELLPRHEAQRRFGFDAFFTGDDHKRAGSDEEERRLNELGADLIFFPYSKEQSSTSIQSKLLSPVKKESARKSKYIFPFDKIKSGGNIIIYGGGVVGTDFLHTLRFTGYCNVVAVLDRDKAGSETAGYPIVKPESITGINPESYDTVLVAIKSQRKQSAVAENLKKHGVRPEKILLFDETLVVRDGEEECVIVPDDGGEVLRLALVHSDGLGDRLFMQTLAYGLRRAVPNGFVIDDYGYQSQEFFQRAPFIDKVYTNNEFSEVNNDYDVVLAGHWLPLPIKLSLEKAKRLSAPLYEYLSSLLWQYENVFYKRRSGNTLDIKSAGSILGLKRIEFSDLDRLLPFDHFTPVYVEYDLNAYALVESVGLSQSQYITLCDDVNVDEPKSLKLWPNEHFKTLARLLKETYPQYKLVRIGVGGKPGEIANADYDFCGQTTLDELCAILKHSVLHIGCEGGLVHLKHGLNGVSVCMFGPTSFENLSYAENINLRSSEPHNCMDGCSYIGKSWGRDICLLDREAQYAPCMTSLTPEYVFEKISEYLDKLPNLKYEQYGTISPDKIETIIGEGMDAALIYREGDEYVLQFAKKLKSLIIIDKDLSEEPIINEAPINMRYSQRMQSLGVETEYGNLRNLPAAAGRYDLTICFTMPKEEYPEFALREMARVTKPGRTFAVMTGSGDLALYRVMYE